MLPNDDGLARLLGRERGLARLLLVVAVWGLVLIGAWEWAASQAAQPAVVAAGTVGLAAAYGAALSVLAMVLVRRTARSHDGALLELNRQTERGKRLSIYDQETGLFHRWYFEFRLDGEIKRSQRYGLPLSVVVVTIALPEESVPPAAPELLNADLALLIARCVRAVDIPASLGQLEYALCLPQSDGASAEATASRLADVLKDYAPAVGIALYPEDSADGKTLIERARQRANPESWAQSA